MKLAGEMFHPPPVTRLPLEQYKSLFLGLVTIAGLQLGFIARTALLDGRLEGKFKIAP